MSIAASSRYRGRKARKANCSACRTEIDGCLTRLRPAARIAVMGIRPSKQIAAATLSLLLFGAFSAHAAAGDTQALAQGFKDEDACNKPYAETLDAKAFIT